MKGGQKCNKRKKLWGKVHCTADVWKCLWGSFAFDYPSVSALAWLFLHHVKSHTGSHQSPWFTPWDWPADMSTLKEVFSAMNISEIPTVSKKITEGVSRASLLCFPSRDLGLSSCLCCLWLNQYLDDTHPNTVGKWSIYFFCQCWSALIFSYPGAE